MSLAPLVGAARRLRIVHRTGFRYAEEVGASYNEARMTPLTTPTQTALEASVEISPVTSSMSYWDYWGSQVTAFEVLTPHRELTVVSRSTVETAPVDASPSGIDWETLHADPSVDSNIEWLAQTPFTEPADEVLALSREAAGDLAPEAAARSVCEALRARLEYESGVTGVYTRASDAWEARSGVCQDFAHLTIGALRSLGIPARYVSGYQHPKAWAQIGETIEGESHAWIEWWTGSWQPYDPTSVSTAGADHVVVGRGRDYSDVTPLKGVYSGPASSKLFVSVEMTRLT